MSNWVTTSSFFPVKSGRYSTRGLSEITTPAAWVEACRGSPSSTREIWINSPTSGFWSASPISLGSCFNASSRLMLRTSGTILAMASTSPSGISRARPTSRITARVFNFPKVMIWATFSPPPYFSTTYLKTRSRPLMQKSTSMSGMLFRAGLRKRSKINPYSIGSRLVIPNE